MSPPAQGFPPPDPVSSPSLRTYFATTLGCKLNQFDSASMEGDLIRLGLQRVEDPAQARILLVNTCTVTSAADAQSRQAIRKLRRKNPRGLLLVTGCYAQRDPAALEAIDGVDAVVGLSAQRELPNLVVRLAPEVVRDPSCITSGEDPLPYYADRTRAFLKIQEGCDLKCSYCVIPSVRGLSRSVEPDRILEKTAKLVEAGYREIVFTGVNTGDYGKDLGPPTTLAALLKRVERVEGLGRIRLNSVEPRCLTAELVETMAGSPKIAPHLQIPLQSGSDTVLARMRRNYRTDFYLRKLEEIRRAIPQVGLGADLIVGFPGETEREFEETMNLVGDSELNYLHVFSYTPRPGTLAAALPGALRGDIIRDRSARLRALGAAASHRFRSSFLGRKLEVLSFREFQPDGRMRALSGNYIEVSLENRPGLEANQILHAQVTQVNSGRVHAIPCLS